MIHRVGENFHLFKINGKTIKLNPAKPSPEPKVKHKSSPWTTSKQNIQILSKNKFDMIGQESGVMLTLVVKGISPELSFIRRLPN